MLLEELKRSELIDSQRLELPPVTCVQVDSHYPAARIEVLHA